MSTYPDHILRLGSQQLAELKRKAAEFERQLWDAHESLEYEVTQSFAAAQVAGPGQGVSDWEAHDPGGHDPQAHDPAGHDPAGHDPGAHGPAAHGPGAHCPAAHGPAAHGPEAIGWPAGGVDADAAGGTPAAGTARDPVAAPAAGRWRGATGPGRSPEERTADLVSHGRHPSRRRHPIRRLARAALIAAALTAAVTALVLTVARPSPAWPASVAKVEREIATACQNADVKAEPSQVNFACARGTRQILWVFSLLTSGNNPDYASIKTGRQGLEPITPAQGGEVAWSLNLHHPYDPANPIDSLEVAARAINNIIGGATLTSANGKPVVQPGLESIAANCARYTGSGAVTRRSGFPGLCARAISGAAGQASLVADVFQKWVVGAPPSRAQDAAVLFQNANNPGDPRVQAILRSIQARLSG